MLLRRKGIERVEARSFRIPTDAPEADGTFAWDSTTMVVVDIHAGGEHGLGYTYTSAAAARLIAEALAPVVVGLEPMDTPRLWAAMVAAVRNVGWQGLSANAISAVDSALWDLKARLLGVSTAELIGRRSDAVAIYGSGGFIGQSDERLAQQLGGWVHDFGCRSVKMKIGQDRRRDGERVAAARRAIGDADLMVDANGAYDAKQALEVAEDIAEHGVVWFEEPVSSDHLDDLALVRRHAPASVEIAAGEYAYEAFYVRRMLEARAVDVLQLDVTRCLGLTGFLKAAALAEAHGMPISAHTAPALHVPVACAVGRMRHVEWFHDHARIEAMLFDGVPAPQAGVVRPDLSRPGHGLAFKWQDAERFAA